MAAHTSRPSPFRVPDTNDDFSWENGLAVLNDNHDPVEAIYEAPAPPPPEPNGVYALPTEVLFGKFNEFVAIRESPPPAPTNTDVPRGINILPSEVLFKIFQALAAPTDPPSKPGEALSWCVARRVSTDWLVVNLVCRHWHRVACAFPVLWRTIDVGTSVEWLQLCLARSGGAPLDVLLYDHTTLFRAAVLLLAHAGRIRSLRVAREAAADALHALSSLFMAGMPTLEELSLDAGKRDAPFAGKCLYDVFRLDQESERMFPSLRVLHLDALYLPPRASLLRDLRVLELIESQPEGPRPTTRITFDEFLDALDACHHTLEHLTLWNSFPFCLCNACGGPGSPDRAVALPKLLTLSLLCPAGEGTVTLGDGSETTGCRHFLEHLRLPQRVLAMVSAARLADERKRFRQYVPADPAVFPILSTAQRALLMGPSHFEAYIPCACESRNSRGMHAQLRLGDGREGEGAEEAAHTHVPESHGGWCGQSLTMGILHVEDCTVDVAEEDAAAREFGALVKHAPLQRLEVYYGPSAAGFGDLFGMLRGLTMLVLQCGGLATRKQVRDFLLALGGRHNLDSGNQHAGESAKRKKGKKGKGKEKEVQVGRVPLPELRELCLHHVCWYGGFAQDLQRCLRSRVEGGASKLAELHVVLFSYEETKKEKLNEKRAQQLRALPELAETSVLLHFSTFGTCEDAVCHG